MKPAIIATHYLPHIGGLELATYHLANELTKQNNEVHIITPYPATKEEEVRNTAIRTHRHPIHTYPDEAKIRSFIDGLLFFKKALQTIKEIKPDIIHSQNITNSIPAYIAWKRYKIPYVICIHGNLDLMGPFLPKPLKHFWANLPHIRNAAKIIALTPEMGKRIETELRQEAEIIPNGIDQESFYPSFNKNMNLENPVIITCSRIDDKKGLEYVIKSMPKILEAYPNAKLRILGDGDFRPVLDKLVAELSLNNSVELMGFIPNTDVPDYLRDADIFLLPSLFEGLPLTLLEAMACGLPIISTPVSIAPDIINTWENGVLVPFKSPDAISDAVVHLLSNPHLMKRMQQNSVAATEKTASWKSIAKHYHALYQEIINQGVQ